MKEEYRKKYLKLRKTISNKEVKDKYIYSKVINNKLINNASLVLIYASLSDEVDTFKIINYLLKNKNVALPKIIDNQMKFYYINSLDDLKPGFFNVFEPITTKEVKRFTNCVSITPGICFSRDLYRLGYGKGFYDKFYSRHKKIYKIGICYKELLLDYIPHDKFDQKVNEIISD